MESMTLIFGILLGFILGLALMKIQSLFERKKVRKESLKGSRNQILGELYEKILPALPNFPYAPKDMVFIGKGCDYIIFHGLSSGKLKEIIFLELKSGSATLNYNEQSIRSAIEKHRVRFSEYRIQSKKSME